jgi:hypothetical protein
MSSLRQRLTLVRHAKSTIVQYISTFVRYITRRLTTETALCRDGVATRVQHAVAERVHLSLSQMFTTYGKELERVEVFKYLGCLLAYDNNNAQAVRGNLKKAHAVWLRLSRTIRSENASPHACGIFYKATV